MTEQSPATARLIERFANREATVAIVGLGYVGLPLLLRFSEVGFQVLGVDVDHDKLERLRRGESYVEHIDSARVGDAIGRGAAFESDFSALEGADAIILCVPTPLNRYREPDMSYVLGTVESVCPHLRAGQVISLESTTYPGTTEEELLPRVRRAGLEVGEEVFLVYSPEREDPGNGRFDTATIPKLLGGVTGACADVGVALYSAAVDRVVPVSSTRVAEMTKLLENIHRAVNIGLVNEMKVVADAMGIDIFEVVDAAATKPFGFTPYYPGPGLGGHCIPIDPFYLTWKAREFGLHTRFIELSGEINAGMPGYVVGKLVDGLNQRGKALSTSRILVLGIAYKKNVDDMRESPSVEIMELLREKGATVAYSDPHVPTFPRMRQHAFDLTSIELDAGVLGSFDAVILATDHDAFDYELIGAASSMLVDTRGRFRSDAPNLVKA